MVQRGLDGAGCGFAQGEDAGEQGSKCLSFDDAGYRPRSQGGARRRRHLGSLVRGRGTLCRRAAGSDPRIRRELSVGARRQRSHHRHSAVFTICVAARAGVVAARERVLVHRSRGGRSRPDISGPVRARRTVQCGLADHRLALHGLARRVSGSRRWLRAAEIRKLQLHSTRLGR